MSSTRDPPAGAIPPWEQEPVAGLSSRKRIPEPAPAGRRQLVQAAFASAGNRRIFCVHVRFNCFADGQVLDEAGPQPVPPRGDSSAALHSNLTPKFREASARSAG